MPPWLVLLGQPGDLGVDRLGDLLGDQPARVPGEIAEQEGRKQREHREIDQRQLERGGADSLPSAVIQAARHGRFSRRSADHLLSRIMYPAPRTVCSSGCAKPLSIFERSREMCTSMTLVCGSK